MKAGIYRACDPPTSLDTPSARKGRRDGWVFDTAPSGIDRLTSSNGEGLWKSFRTWIKGLLIESTRCFGRSPRQGKWQAGLSACGDSGGGYQPERAVSSVILLSRAH